MTLARILKDNNDAITLAAFYKYDLNTVAGLVPKIQITVRTNKTKNFQDFNGGITKSAESLKKFLDDFEFIEAPKEAEISGIKSMFLIGKFTVKMLDGQVLRARSRTYAIPMGNYFFQVDFTDGQVEEDCSVEFDQLVKSIKIGRFK